MASLLGSIFLLAQFLQLVKGYSALEAGGRTLRWTAMLLVIGLARDFYPIASAAEGSSLPAQR